MKSVSLFVLILLLGCAVPKKVTLKSEFNETETRDLIRPGKNIINGNALIRQNGGGVVTCAGNKVILTPVTAYSRERIGTIYGNENSGYQNVRPFMTSYKFTPDPIMYKELMRKETCDAQGNFTFANVADGEFFVVTTITWSAGEYSTQGGTLFKRVSVQSGEMKKVVLSP